MINKQNSKSMKIRELIGKISIQENISPIERNKISNTFVFHVPNPLATYYNRFTEVNKPNSIVFITKNAVSFERILRATKNINNKENTKLEGAKCEVIIGNNKYSGIRLKGIDRYSNIQNIQVAYKNEGFEFNKIVRIKMGTDALVR